MNATIPTPLLRNTDFELVTEFIKPDKKKRITLGAASLMGAFNMYLNKFGQIVLDPVRTVPASEAWLHENKSAMAAVQKGLKESAAGDVHYLGSMTKKRAKNFDVITSRGRFIGSFDRGETYER